MSCTNRYDVSLVCVYNKADLLEEMRRSAESSGLSIECIFLDNMDSSYSCAADALNEGVGLATAPVIVTLHQDVEFLEPSSLVDLVRLVSEGALGLYGIVGSIRFVGTEPSCPASAKARTGLVSIHRLSRTSLRSRRSMNVWSLSAGSYVTSLGLTPPSALDGISTQ